MLILISMGILVVEMVWFFSFPGGRFGQNVLMFGVDMSSSAHVDNKKIDILVLGKGPTQELEHTLTAEKMYPINFTVTKKRFCLSLHYNGANSYLFVNCKEIVKFKAKDCVASPLCLGNISNDWPTDNMKKTGLNGYDYEFSVEYKEFNKLNPNLVIPPIHNYLTRKYDIK